MESSNKAVQVKVDEFLVALEKDCELIEKSFERLVNLRECLIKRDEVSMRQILDSVMMEAKERASNELLREGLREELSQLLGFDVKEMTIGVLGNYLCEQQRDRLFEKRGRLIVLADRLKKEHMRSQMLLAEYSRLNKAFLQKIFNPKKDKAAVYNSKGSVDKSSDAAFLNLKL